MKLKTNSNISSIKAKTFPFFKKRQQQDEGAILPNRAVPIAWRHPPRTQAPETDRRPISPSPKPAFGSHSWLPGSLPTVKT